METSETNMISVLVVDDQPGVRRLLQEVLEEEGFEVRLAECGEAALRQVRGKTPDLILMDMKMPGMSGLEVLRELKKSSYQHPVVMMTAYGELEFVKQACRLGAIHHLTKPFDIFEVKALLQQLVRKETKISQVVL